MNDIISVVSRLDDKLKDMIHLLQSLKTEKQRLSMENQTLKKDLAESKSQLDKLIYEKSNVEQLTKTDHTETKRIIDEALKEIDQYLVKMEEK